MREEIREIINNMGADEQVALHNRYCDEVGYSDDEIFSMDEINEWLAGKDPDEILRMAFYGDFRPCDEYFRFNGYANLESTDYPDEWIDIDDIVDYIIDNDEDFDNDEIRDILDEEEEEEDEEEEEEEEEDEE